MRNSKIVLGAVLVLAVLGGLFFNPLTSDLDVTSKYKPRVNKSLKMRLADEQRELYEMVRRNVVTGKFDPADWKRAKLMVEKFDAENQGSRATNISWIERGPDNIGGRTRAVLVDVTNVNHVFAGSVSGGLFESFNGGNTWTKVQGFTDNLSISSIAQATVAPYKILVGTGSIREGFVGNGVYESDDLGVTWSSISNTTGYSAVNEIVYGKTQNKFYLTTSNGLKELAGNAAIGTGVSNATGTNAPTNSCEGLAVSPDGRVMVLGALIGGTRTYTSNDYGANWTNVGGGTAGKVPTGSARIEYAVSHTTVSGKYYVYAVGANSTLTGAYVSLEDGDDGTWNQIAPSSSPGFQPFSTGGGGQGTYDNIVGVYPSSAGKALLGGIDIYDWNIAAGSFPPFGQWEQKSFWFVSPNSPMYVHADNHEFEWDKNGNLYIGNDGGIGKSLAGSSLGVDFMPMNKGYNVTQFYGLGFSKHGHLIGGTQDNGTLYNDFTNATINEFEELLGGDGFDGDISFLFPEVVFGTLYYGSISRTNDKGQNWTTFYSPAMLSCGTPGSISPGTGLGSFNTVIRLWETPNDPNSTDSVTYIPSTSLSAGDTVLTNGLSNDNEILHILTAPLTVLDTLVYTSDTVILGDTLYVFINPNTGDTIGIDPLPFMTNVALDTLRIQDPVQSWFAFGLTSGSGSCEGVWITRDALRFGTDPFWWHIPINYNGNARPYAIEFSADGNHMFVGASDGTLYRVSGIGTLYGNDLDTGYAANDPSILPSSVTITTLHSTSAPITGIGVDPQDKDHVVITLGGFGGGGHVLESTTATTATGTGSFSSIQGNLPSMPVHDAVIDRNNSNLIIIGTEFGVYATDNGGSTWTDNSGDMGKVPVYTVRQNWRTWDEGNRRPGELYAGTFGRGLWSSGTYLSLPDDITHNTITNPVNNLLVYPNPTTTSSTVVFDLNQRTDVRIAVYTLTGRKVKDLNSGSMGTGRHRIELPTEGLPSGTYIIDVRTNDTRKTAKLIITK